jgi:PAS domain S-box-containing protein
LSPLVLAIVCASALVVSAGAVVLAVRWRRLARLHGRWCESERATRQSLLRELEQVAGRDREERQRVEEERLFQARLLETLHDAVIGLDAALCVRCWNPAAERLYGWNASEVLGRHVRDVLRTEFADGEAGRERLFREIAAAGRVRTNLVQYRRDGSRIEIDGESTAIRGPEGAITGYLLANRDVTERKQTAAALRASEAKFRAAFHGANTGILLIDAEGRVLEFNRAFRTLLGYDLEELARSRMPDLLHPDDLVRSREAVADMLEGSRDAVTDERRYRRKDGSYAHTFERASAVRDASGRFLYAVAVIEDVTEKRAFQAQLLFADRMASMGRLAAGVAHEINNPLSFILANLSFLSGELEKGRPVDHQLLQALEDTRLGAQRVREIVRGLKAFSRPDERRDQVVDVREVLRFSLALAQNEIRHRARLVLDLREVPPVAGSGDRLGQVFVNLLINAAQAIEEGHSGENELRVTSRLSEDGRVLVEVSDTGCGIPAHVLPHIFDPFFTTKPAEVATGLGLSICHGIVTGLGGEINVRSEEGQGSAFSVLLPPGPPGDRAAAQGSAHMAAAEIS